MTKSVRATLLIIAAVFGVLQVSIPISNLIDGSFANSLWDVVLKISWFLLLPAAALGLLAALFLGKVTKSRLFAASAAGVALLSVLLPIGYYLVRNIQFDTPINEVLQFAWTDFRFLLGFWPVEDYFYWWHKWIRVLGSIAIILWTVCAAFPAKKGSAGMHGAHAAGMPNSFPNNAIPANPMPSSYPAPVIPAPVIPPASQGAKFCTNCGKPLVGTAKFCAECGTPT